MKRSPPGKGGFRFFRLRGVCGERLLRQSPGGLFRGGAYALCGSTFGLCERTFGNRLFLFDTDLLRRLRSLRLGTPVALEPDLDKLPRDGTIIHRSRL